jgi:hypothetical protein
MNASRARMQIMYFGMDSPKYVISITPAVYFGQVPLDLSMSCTFKLSLLYALRIKVKKPLHRTSMK